MSGPGWSGSAGGTFTVQAEFNTFRLRISVTDAGGTTIPRPCTEAPDPLSMNGRGLRLVESCALWWRATVVRNSCTVIADIALTQSGRHTTTL